MRGIRIIAVAGTSVLCIASVVVAAQAIGADASGQTSDALPTGDPASVRLAALDSPASGLPAAVQAVPQGANPSKFRQGAALSADRHLFVGAGPDNSVCLVSQAPTADVGGCTSRALLARKPFLAASANADQSFSLQGVVTDGAATVTTSSGKTAPVVNNTFALEGLRGGDVLTLRDGSGNVVYEQTLMSPPPTPR